MPFPTVQYDATNGSDTNPTGAIATGTNADLSGTTVTLNETVDFTGVADDDSDYLWYSGDAGDKHLFQITAFNPSVAACTSLTVATAGTTRTAKNWAVNGERQTMLNDSSQYDWEDFLAGWTLEFQDGTYDIPVRIDTKGNSTDGPITYKAAVGHSPTLRTTANIPFFNDLSGYWFKGITFTTSASPKTSTTMCYRTNGGGYLLMEDCVIDGLQSGITGYFTHSGTAIRTTVKNCVSSGVNYGVQGIAMTWIACRFIENGGWGVINSNSNGGDTYMFCVFHGNASGGLYTSGTGSPSVINCVFDGNTGDGLKVHGAQRSISVVNNLFTNNTGNGLNGTTAPSIRPLFADFNAFLANGTDRSNVPTGPNDVTLSVDPYTAIGSDDFTLNATAGGGAACRNAGLNGFDIGTAQHADAGGGLSGYPLSRLIGGV